MTSPTFLSKRISSAPNKEELRVRTLLAGRTSTTVHAVAKMYSQSSFVRDLACLP
ncbi:hypothetical protein ACFQPC_04350 [Herminiimonas glaciei]|uniref:Uncharacterized protein n=1 Tax=Herminiimonas glaciei TaxID=523788 RepID=A0ABW2I8D7_9BURK